VGIFSSLCSFSISQLLLAEWNYKIPPSLESSSYIFSLVIFFCLCEFFPPSLSFLTHSLTLYICSLPLRSRVFACSLAFLHGFVCARESRAISLLLCARHVYNSQFRLYTKYDVLLSPPAIYFARTYFWLQAQRLFRPPRRTPACAYLLRETSLFAPTHTHIYTRSLGGSVYICTDEPYTALGTTYDLAFLGRRRATSSAMFIWYVSGSMEHKRRL
jgi:hypothetical protein